MDEIDLLINKYAIEDQILRIQLLLDLIDPKAYHSHRRNRVRLMY